MDIGKLLFSYSERKDEIKDKLKEFRENWNKPDKKIFSELCFCICVPQSRAELCEKAVSELSKSEILYTGSEKQVRDGLKGVRFPNNKTRFILEARDYFSSGSKIKSKLNTEDIAGLRNWLAANISGLGYKESSHFLRNIGFGKDLAILDRHILKNLKRYGIISAIPKTLTKKRYLEIEEKMVKFSEKIGIPLGELDLVLWSEETGKIIK